MSDRCNISITGYMGITNPNPIRMVEMAFEEDATEEDIALAVFTYTQWKRFSRKAKKRNVKTETLLDRAIAKGDHWRLYKFSTGE